MLGAEMSLVVVVRWIWAVRLRGKLAKDSPLLPAVTISEGLCPDAAKRASSDAELTRMTIGPLAVGAGCSGDADAAGVGCGPVEGLGARGVVDGEDGGDSGLSECAEAASGESVVLGA